MLKRLYIKNYALFQEVDVDFSAHLNLLTGETGAGKSILIGAIGLILGKRADSSIVMKDAKKCIIEAEFHLNTHQDQIIQNFSEDFDLNADSILLIRREVSSSGKSRAFINDTPVNLTVLKNITQYLIDLHGQHDGQLLMDPIEQLKILDDYAGLTSIVNEFGRQLTKINEISKNIQELNIKEQEAKRQYDYYQFQLSELSEANLDIEEEKEIEHQQRIMENASQISDVLTQTSYIFTESETAILSQISNSVKALEKISGFDEGINNLVENIKQAQIILNDAFNDLSGLEDQFTFNPHQLEILNERLNVYNKLKLKFSVQTVEELLAIQNEYEEKLNSIDSIQDEIQKLEKGRAEHLKEINKLGLEIEQKRREAAKELEQGILQTLVEVGLNKTKFEIDIQTNYYEEGHLMYDGKAIKPNKYGWNSVDFKVQTNPGLPLGNLSQVASGGEISRIMLAIKRALAEKLALSVLIFDEIDTGISGEVALKVGKVMEQLAKKHQVIVITHLPQIASRGKDHFYIYKSVEGDATYTKIKKLSHEDRIKEVATIMSGENPTEAALASARELFD